MKKLTNLMLPHLQTVLVRQKIHYGIDKTFSMENPVSDQAVSTDATPVHNIGMERKCGKVDQRLRKEFGSLNVSSSCRRARN